MRFRALIKFILFSLILLVLLCGLSRLYFALTGGFRIGNITSERIYEPRWEISLSTEHKNEINEILSQPFAYLGKGCQAYVFASQDGQYVIKFFKYQRFRPQAWINLLTYVPAVHHYQEIKKSEKKEKLDKVYRSWKVAFEHLKSETGVVYVHLNKTDHWHHMLMIRDKLGLPHHIDLDKMEFLLQRRAQMLCPTIEQSMKLNMPKEAMQLIDHLLVMLVNEYLRGFADNDHALMQNTGVINGQPIHIDVGQFVYNETVKDPKIFKQELYDKTYKLHLWLQKHYPQLAMHLKTRLLNILGIDYFYQAPYVHKGDVAKIPHQD